MKVSELFSRLSFGELSNIAIGNDATGEIQEQHVGKLMSYTNEALLRLYTKFVIKEDSLALEIVEGTTRYYLNSEHAKSETPTGYIIDTEEEPFRDNLIKVLQVFTPARQELPLNDAGNLCSVFTPQPEVLQVPVPDRYEVLVVVYQARHEAVSALDDDIHLPSSLEGALAIYVAHLVYFHMNGQENTAKSNDYLAKFEMICEEIQEGDLVSESISTSTTKLHDRGFV